MLDNRGDSVCRNSKGPGGVKRPGPFRATAENAFYQSIPRFTRKMRGSSTCVGVGQVALSSGA